MSEGTITGILDMTKADPLFESLFNLFTPYTAGENSCRISFIVSFKPFWIVRVLDYNKI